MQKLWVKYSLFQLCLWDLLPMCCDFGPSCWLSTTSLITQSRVHWHICKSLFLCGLTRGQYYLPHKDNNTHSMTSTKRHNLNSPKECPFQEGQQPQLYNLKCSCSVFTDLCHFQGRTENGACRLRSFVWQYNFAVILTVEVHERTTIRWSNQVSRFPKLSGKCRKMSGRATPCLTVTHRLWVKSSVIGHPDNKLPVQKEGLSKAHFSNI